MKGLRVKKIYEDDVGYGSWKPNSKKRKEMIFEVVNSSGRKTRKKRGGAHGFKVGQIIRSPPSEEFTFNAEDLRLSFRIISIEGDNMSIMETGGQVINHVHASVLWGANWRPVKPKDSPSAGSGGKRHKKKTRKKRD